jgi:hypothetical protein
MSGKRHHFVPRFLQRGFASHIKDGNVFTWVYRRHGPPFNTQAVGSGLYFISPYRSQPFAPKKPSLTKPLCSGASPIRLHYGRSC